MQSRAAWLAFDARQWHDDVSAMKFAALFSMCLAVFGAADPAMLQADRAFAAALAKSDPAIDKWFDADFQSTPRPPFAPIVADEKGAEIHAYTYGQLGDVQVNLGRAHVLRVWVKRAGGWKLIVYQEVKSLDAAPSFAPGAGAECENPCKGVPYRPANETERQVVAAYSKLETAAHARISAAFAQVVADEFVAVSSNSDKISTKRARMDDFDHSKNSGVAPTPLVSARFFAFGDAVLMVSEHKPDRGSPLHVTRIWVKRGGDWTETLSYQTAISP